MADDPVDTAAELIAAGLVTAGAAITAMHVADLWTDRVKRERREAEKDTCPPL